MRLQHIFRLRTAIAFLVSGLVTFLASITLETFLFRPLVKAMPSLFPWNRELNGLSMILAAMVGGALAIQIARSFSLWTLTRDEEQHPEWLLVAAGAGVAVILWLLRRVAPANPLTVGWRGILMAAAAAAAGGSLLVGGRSRRICVGALVAALLLGFLTVDYDTYAYDLAIPSQRALLWGEVTVPGRRSGTTYPAVLLVHDQGALDRDGTRGASTPYRDIAEYLARQGYVVLRYDKRGTGESSGVFPQVGMEETVQDVLSAASVLSAQDEVQGQSLFLIAHGYGGQVATLAAQIDPDLFDGLVLLNVPADPVDEVLLRQEAYAQETLGTPGTEIENRLQALDDWIGGVRSRRFLNYGDYFGRNGISEELQARQRSEPMPPAWMRQALEHDQPSALAAIPQPVLLVAGTSDWRVPSDQAEAMAAALALAGRSDWELIQLEGVDHDLFAAETKEQSFLSEQSGAYTSERHQVTPEVLDALLHWLNSQLDAGTSQRE
jgi:alpha-beta hydrolase superfamily lysophospholipase